MNDSYRAAIEREIRERRKEELWYRKYRWAYWPDLRHENAVILKALVKIRREIRQAERRAEQRDCITLSKAAYDQLLSVGGWSESEKAAAWGR